MTVPGKYKVADLKLPLPPKDASWPLPVHIMVDVNCVRVDFESACQFHAIILVQAIDRISGIQIIDNSLRGQVKYHPQFGNVYVITAIIERIRRTAPKLIPTTICQFATRRR